MTTTETPAPLPPRVDNCACGAVELDPTIGHERFLIDGIRHAAPACLDNELVDQALDAEELDTLVCEMAEPEVDPHAWPALVSLDEARVAVLAELRADLPAYASADRMLARLDQLLDRATDDLADAEGAA